MKQELDMTPDIFDQIYQFYYDAKYAQLPHPFVLAKSTSIAYTIQFMILLGPVPQDADPSRPYYLIIQHVFLHRIKTSAKDCIAMGKGNPMHFEWGKNIRYRFATLNFMMIRR